MDYAVFVSGGKQYRVSPGQTLDVEKLNVEPGSEIELDNVLAVSRDGQLQVGKPQVPGAKVIAHVQQQYRDKKIRVFKYKPKIRYRRNKGHRQPYTRIQIAEIAVEQGDSDGS